MKAGDPGVEAAKKRMPWLSRGDTMEAERRASSQRNGNWEEQRHTNQRCLIKGPSVVLGAPEMSREVGNDAHKASGVRATLTFIHSSEMFNWSSLVSLGKG